jgi:hypothetical protein
MNPGSKLQLSFCHCFSFWERLGPTRAFWFLRRVAVELLRESRFYLCLSKISKCLNGWELHRS